MVAQLVILPFVLALVLSTAITYLTIQIYRGMGLLDHSTRQKHPKNIHTTPVPRGGGIPIFFALFATVLLFGHFDTHMAAIFVGAFLLMVTGILDDIADISPYLRLGIGASAAAIVVLSGIGIGFVSNPLGGSPLDFGQWTFQLTLGTLPITLNLLADALAVLWIVWGMNFVNMGAKGLDGQLPGVIVIAASVMGILSFRFANDLTTWPASYLAFATAGAYGGFLLFNVYPQKIMPGWGGGSQAGYFLAVISILSGAKLATALIVLGVPLMDVIYAVLRRIRAGRSPVWGDDQHLHHQLLKMGWSKRQVALFYWIFTLVLGLAALQLNSQMKIYTIILVAVIVGGMLLWINSFLSQKPRE